MNIDTKTLHYKFFPAIHPPEQTPTNSDAMGENNTQKALWGEI